MIRSDRPTDLLALLAFVLAAPLGAQLTDLGAKLLDECDPPGNCAAFDSFGSALAVGDFDNDGFDDLAVGVPGETVSGNQNAGAIHVFYGEPGGLVFAGQQIFHQNSPGVPNTSEVGDFFGETLAVGDFNLDGFDDLAIGAPEEDVGSIVDAGAVFILFGGPNGLTSSGSFQIDQNQLPSGSGESAEAQDSFGQALAARGTSLAVGVPGEDFVLPTEVSSGLVHILSRTAGGQTLGQVADREQNDFLGVCGSFDGNEFQEFWGSALAWGRVSASSASLLVSGRLESFDDISEAGRVTFMFGASSGCVDQDTSGIVEVADPFDHFGSSLATGDFNGDGLEDLAVGVPGESFGLALADPGGVHVIYGSSSGLTATGDHIYSQSDFAGGEGREANDRFGAALATGDFDGDGRADLAIGVPSENVGSIVDAGIVQILYGSSSGLTTTGNQTFSCDSPPGMPDSSNTNDFMGSALATGDFDGNGVDDLAIGIPGEAIGAASATGEVIILYGLDRSTGAFGTVRMGGSAASFSESAGVRPFLVFRDGGAPVSASVDRVLVGGTATPGVDFTYTNGSESWGVGDVSFESFAVTIKQDRNDEPNETLVIALVNPSPGLALGTPATLTITIEDDDPAGSVFWDDFESSNLLFWSSTTGAS